MSSSRKNRGRFRNNKVDYKVQSGIYWTCLELKGLLEDDDSCVHYERHRKHIGMLPSHARNVTSALSDVLNCDLNAYDNELKGLLLAYKNPTLLSGFVDTLEDSCYFHMDIEADFYIFKPKIGCSLKGFVNKKGSNHIGVLVHKIFIVSIPKPEEEENWPGDDVNIGQEIRFTVTQLDFSCKLPFIRGALHEEEYLAGCKLFNPEDEETYVEDELLDRKDNINLNID